MTKLLDLAIETARELSASEQDEIARVIMALTASGPGRTIQLSADEAAAIARSRAAAERGEFADDADVKAVWAKHGQ